MNSLTVDWKVRQLKDVAQIITGTTPPKSDESNYGGDIPFVTPAELGSSNAILTASTKLTSLGVSKTRLLPEHSVLVCCIGSLGKTGYLGCEASTNQQINALSFDHTQVNPRYGYHYCRTLKPLLKHMAPKTTVPIVNKGRFGKLTIPLPPLAEQQRIAAILDTADAVRKKRQQALALTDELLHATFLDMFGDPVTNPKGWEVATVADLCENSDDVRCGPFGTQLHQHEFARSGVALWGIKHVNAGFAFQTDEFVSAMKAETLANYSIIPMDLVMTRKGTIGNCHVYPSSLEPGIMHSDLLRLRLSPAKADAHFVCSQFTYSGYIQRQLVLMSPGAVMPGINVTKLKKLQVEVPPLDLQQHFAEIVEATERKKASQRADLAELDTLFNALVQRAFRGDL